MDKWPIELKEDMEQVFISSPELLKILKEEKEFEDMMNRRSFEESSPELEEEILESALRKEQNYKDLQPNPSFLSSILSIIPIPHPAFALSLLLVIGIGVGFFYSSNFSSEESEGIDGVQFAELIYYQEGFYE
jgi:hypothetical protein